MTKKAPKKYIGVSLFEVLAAIILFGVGILTIFSMIINNITRMENVKQKNTATMLAKEGLDIIYNMRDTNIRRGMVRNCANFDTGSSNNCGGTFYKGGTSLYGGSGTDYIIIRDINQTGSEVYQLQEISNESQGLLYLHTGNVSTTGSALTGFRYNHNALGGYETKYTRVITFFPSNLYPEHTGYVLGITSRVIIKAGTKRKEVVLESLIGCIFGEGSCQ